MSIETQVWEPDPERAGYSRHVHTKTIQEVFDEIRALVGEYPDGAEEYFMLATSAQMPAEMEWPQGQIAVFPVTGGSEGHYIHVEVLNTGGYAADPLVAENGRVLVILGKTFMGWDAAWAFSKSLAETLGV